MNIASVETKGKKVTMGKVLESMGTIFFLFVSALAGCRFPPSTVPTVSPDGGGAAIDGATETVDGAGEDAGDVDAEPCMEWAQGEADDGSLYIVPITCERANELRKLQQKEEEIHPTLPDGMKRF